MNTPTAFTLDHVVAHQNELRTAAHRARLARSVRTADGKPAARRRLSWPRTRSAVPA